MTDKKTALDAFTEFHINTEVDPKTTITLTATFNLTKEDVVHALCADNVQVFDKIYHTPTQQLIELLLIKKFGKIELTLKQIQDEK